MVSSGLYRPPAASSTTSTTWAKPATISQLRRVTFRYKQAQADGSHPLQCGLIAEEVAKVYPELVQYSATGEVNTVLYHELLALLLNEVQKQPAQIEVRSDR
jgi:hypothetical protein